MKLSLFTIMILFSFSSCTREVAMLDYREEYIGTYNCIQYNKTAHFGMATIYDTTSIQLVITKDMNSLDKIIVNSEAVILQQNGIAEKTDNPPTSPYHITFRNDSIYFYRANYYMMGSVEVNIIGVK